MMKYNGTQDEYERCLEFGFRKAIVANNLAVLSAQEGAVDAALENLKKALQYDPNLAEAHYKEEQNSSLHHRLTPPTVAHSRSMSIMRRKLNCSSNHYQKVLAQAYLKENIHSTKAVIYCWNGEKI